jgi:predicted ATPase
VRSDFDDLLRDALKNLHDVAYLQTHPLTAFVPSEQHVAAIQVGRLLAQHLRDAIAALHNETAPAARSEGERRYRLLRLRYLEGLSPELVQRELSISRSTYQREHSTALAALTSLLREQWRVANAELPEAGQTTGPRLAPPAIDPAAGGVPAQLTSFVGRRRELQTVIDMLGAGRLVTLTGPPGIGKTRLALEVAARLASSFADGICSVSLASIRDPALVVSSIARARRVRELPGQALLEALADDLRERHLLLILDNFEQILPSAPTVANLLASAPRLHALVTSRAPLHVRGEGVFQLPPLAVPITSSGSSLASAVAASDDDAAIRLFVDRARAARADFTLADENVDDVIEICRRVDGLPLAIELAAARSRILSIRAMRARLESRLGLLTSGQRDLPERQQTLRAAIDWSYDLLDADAKRLLWRLAVFAGGCDLAAVEAVCLEGLGALTTLVDQSLLLREDQPNAESRFRMLESIREYALERLTESSETDEVWRRYAAYFRALGERATAQLMTPAHTDLLQQLDREHDNLRAVLRRLTDRGEVAASLELAGALAWYWLNRNFWSEGRRWLQRALDLPDGLEGSPARASALLGAGILAVAQGDFAAARGLLQESIRLFRAANDQRNLAVGLGALANVAVRNRERGARALISEALALFRELGARSSVGSMLLQLGTVLIYERDDVGAESALREGLAIWQDVGDHPWIAEALRRLGHLALVQGDNVLARARFDESLATYRQLQGREGIAKQGTAVVLSLLGELERRAGRPEQAAILQEEALRLAHELGDADTVASALLELGRVKRDQHDLGGALASFRESLRQRQRQGHLWGILATLGEIAACAGELGDLPRAVRLSAFVDRLEQIGDVLPTTDPHLGGGASTAIERHLPLARATFGDQVIAEQRAIGRALTLAEAIADALQPQPPSV